jgi:tetratricopeptide (TPR) repeat protein
VHRCRVGGTYDAGVDAATAHSLITEAEAARAAMRRGENAAGTEQFERRYAEMCDALDWLLSHGRADEAFRMSAAMTPFWLGSKRVDEGMAWLDRALATSQASDTWRARALHDHGYLAFFSGRYEVGELRFAESRDLARRAADPNGEALALAGLARVALNTNAAEAVRLLREAMDITSDLPDSVGRSSADHVLGVALQLAGDLDGAREVMAERLRQARETGNDFVVFVESSNLSMVERKLGNLEQAEALSLDALRIVTRKRDQMAIPWVINGLAAVMAARGRHDRAATLLGIAASLLARAGGEWPADEREQFEGTVDIVAAALPPGTLEERRASADAMTLEEAVGAAMSGD